MTNDQIRAIISNDHSNYLKASEAEREIIIATCREIARHLDLDPMTDTDRILAMRTAACADIDRRDTERREVYESLLTQYPSRVEQLLG